MPKWRDRPSIERIVWGFLLRLWRMYCGVPEERLSTACRWNRRVETFV